MNSVCSTLLTRVVRTIWKYDVMSLWHVKDVPFWPLLCLSVKSILQKYDIKHCEKTNLGVKWSFKFKQNPQGK